MDAFPLDQMRDALDAAVAKGNTAQTGRLASIENPHEARITLGMIRYYVDQLEDLADGPAHRLTREAVDEVIVSLNRIMREAVGP